MKNKLIVLMGLGLLVLAPVSVYAQAGNVGAIRGCTPGMPVADIQGFICKIGDILNTVVPILVALGVIIFIWGVLTYVLAGDEEAKTAGRDKIIFGIIGLAVIIGLWGLVRILTNTFGVQNAGQNITFPTTPY